MARPEPFGLGGNQRFPSRQLPFKIVLYDVLATMPNAKFRCFASGQQQLICSEIEVLFGQ